MASIFIVIDVQPGSENAFEAGATGAAPLFLADGSWCGRRRRP